MSVDTPLRPRYPRHMSQDPGLLSMLAPLLQGTRDPNQELIIRCLTTTVAQLIKILEEDRKTTAALRAQIEKLQVQLATPSIYDYDPKDPPQLRDLMKDGKALPPGG